MDLFCELTLGDLHLRNRVVMAPMTRSRADEQAVPTPCMIEYYRQRAGAGLRVLGFPDECGPHAVLVERGLHVTGRRR